MRSVFKSFFMTDTSYRPSQIEPRWQKYWQEQGCFSAVDFSPKPKFYCLDMFPYPSGAGLHVGHPLGYTATDVICRKKRQQGYNVLHPMGWDAFGLPAENYALKTGQNPRITTTENIRTFKRQIQSFGFSYDWDREINTTDSSYVRWTQWIFLQMYHRGLLYEKKMNMAWCPHCKIVVANEEIEQGRHERCGNLVTRKSLRQWMFRITQYAERLLQDLDTLPQWPEKIKTMQKNWIGKSQGAEVDFEINDEKVTVFTTRPDTLFGATYFVLSPEHPLVDQITTSKHQKEVENYKKQCSSKSDLERTELNKDKTGVFTGAYATNPVNNERIPVWIADYVLMSYGTGAIMAVPAHDERDFEFAKKFGIKIKTVVSIPDLSVLDGAVLGEGVAMESGFLNGLPTPQAQEKMIQWLEEKGKGQRKVNYKLRDWIFTRQRYWGEPIPMVHDEQGRLYPLDESELPLKLPQVDKYEPSENGESPLAHIRDWVEIEGWVTEKGTVVTKPPQSKSDSENFPKPLYQGSEKRKFFRETSTMPNWAGSSWYWLRYMDPMNEQIFCSKEKEAYWGPVDLYIGGTEHAVLHLLYARFWHKVLYDMDLVSTPEPFAKLVNQGLIMGEDGNKMSKSLGNVINPDDIIAQYGADTLRMYEMFMGPFEQSKAWNTGSVSGVYKFIERLWRLYQKPITDKPEEKKIQTSLHQTIKIVTEHIDEFRFNTAIAQLMVLVNDLTPLKEISRETLKTLVILVSPFAPHVAEEIWQEKLGEKETMMYAPWPTYDPDLLVRDTLRYAVQINGKVRADFEVSSEASREEVLQTARAIPKVQKYLEEGTIRKEIFVPGKIVGWVVK